MKIVEVNPPAGLSTPAQALAMGRWIQAAGLLPPSFARRDDDTTRRAEGTPLNSAGRVALGQDEPVLLPPLVHAGGAVRVNRAVGGGEGLNLTQTRKETLP